MRGDAGSRVHRAPSSLALLATACHVDDPTPTPTPTAATPDQRCILTRADRDHPDCTIVTQTRDGERRFVLPRGFTVNTIFVDGGPDTDHLLTVERPADAYGRGRSFTSWSLEREGFPVVDAVVGTAADQAVYAGIGAALRGR